MSQATKHAAPPAPTTDALDQFSREIAMRLPGRVVRQFTMPKSVREVREVFIMEITGNEEVEAGILADAMSSQIQKSSNKLILEAERRECIRLSIVGTAREEDGRMLYTHANMDGLPFEAPTSWSLRAWTALHRFFSDVNGVPNSELDEGIKGSRVVGAHATPIGATPASAATGR